MANLARAIEGIPVILQAERDSVFPTPERDQRYQDRTTATIYRYDGSSWAVDVDGGKGSVLDARAFGVVADGVTDDTVALQAALDAVSATMGGRIRLPSGTLLITDTLTVTKHRTHLEGAGKVATTILFAPSSAKACFKFRRTTTTEVLYQCSLRGMSFAGSGSAQKIALDFWDSSECHVEEIAVSSTWTGNTSIGIRTQGREFFLCREVDIYADRPVHIVANANVPSLGADHFHFEDTYLAPLVATESSILIDGDVGIANLLLDGYQSWVGGKYGVRMLSGTVPATGLGVVIRNGRFEQPADVTGYAVSWEGAMDNLLIDSTNFGGAGASTNGGLYIRNVNKVTILNSLYTGQGEALNLDSTCEDLTLLGCFWQASSTVSMTGFEEVWSVPKFSTLAPLPPTGSYYRTASGLRQISLVGVPKSRKATTLAVGGTYTLQMSNSGILKTGKVTVSAYSATGPIQEMGIWLVDATGVTKVTGTTNTAAGNVASKLCVVWTSIVAIQVLNNLAQTVTIVVEEDWTT